MKEPKNDWKLCWWRVLPPTIQGISWHVADASRRRGIAGSTCPWAVLGVRARLRFRWPARFRPPWREGAPWRYSHGDALAAGGGAPQRLRDHAGDRAAL